MLQELREEFEPVEALEETLAETIAEGRRPSGADQHCGVTRVLACYELTPGKTAESTTISDRVLLTIVFSSACSLVGTANFSSVC